MNYFFKKIAICAIALSAINNVFATEKISLMLDWFVNPDHAILVIAKEKGFFAKYDLEVEIIEPADPSMPPKMVAAKKVDMAVEYQPQLHMHVDEGLPLMRIATLIATPLNTLIVLQDSNINSIADLKGKTIGYSVNGFEQNLLTTMLATAKLTPEDVKWINVNWSLSPSLISGKVDAVFGGYRNFELNQMKLENYQGKGFYPEEHGVPLYDELVLVINKENVNQQKFNKFLNALEEATVYTLNHPQQAWQAFQNYKPNELDNELNRMAWEETLPRFALRPRALDRYRYQRMANFLVANKIIKKAIKVDDYAIELIDANAP